MPLRCPPGFSNKLFPSSSHDDGGWEPVARALGFAPVLRELYAAPTTAVIPANNARGALATQARARASRLKICPAYSCKCHEILYDICPSSKSGARRDALRYVFPLWDSFFFLIPFRQYRWETHRYHPPSAKRGADRTGDALILRLGDRI